MPKNIVIVNAGPRKGWNTDTLLTEAQNGAAAAGANIERFDLFRLEKYTGCISCFGCKKEKFKGHCICLDGLTPVLDAIRSADGLIIGAPNYLSELTASFRALYERLIFQNLTYNLDSPCCNERMIPVLLIMTSNAPEPAYRDLLEGYRQTLSRFVGPTEVFVSGNTLQLKDYTKTDWPWTMFDPQEKKRGTIWPFRRSARPSLTLRIPWQTPERMPPASAFTVGTGGVSVLGAHEKADAPFRNRVFIGRGSPWISFRRARYSP